MGRLMTVSETARHLERSADWLRDAEAKGKIPKAKRMLGYRRVYSKEDIEHLREILFTPATKSE